MSSISSIVSGVLTSGTDFLRAHKGKLPRERTLPAIVIQVVAGTDDFHLRGPSGLGDRLVQLDAWASTESGAEDYMELAKAKMLATTDFAVARIEVSGAEGYDEDANLYRASREFKIWFDS